MTGGNKSGTIHFQWVKNRSDSTYTKSKLATVGKSLYHHKARTNTSVLRD